MRLNSTSVHTSACGSPDAGSGVGHPIRVISSTTSTRWDGASLPDTIVQPNSPTRFTRMQSIFMSNAGGSPSAHSGLGQPTRSRRVRYFLYLFTGLLAVAGLLPNNSVQAQSTCGALYGGTATASCVSPGGQGASVAFDDNISTVWLCGASAPVQLQYSYTAATTITGYKIVSGADVPARDPKNWTLEGSNDCATWTVVDTRTNETFAARNQTNTYILASPVTFKCYRLNISATFGTGSGVQLAELKLANFTNCQADISIVKTGTVTIVPNGAVYYTLKITNNGPSLANNITVSDPAVSGFTALSVTCGSNNGGIGTGGCPTSPTVSALQAGTLTIPTLTSGDYVVLTVSGTATGANGSSINNIATVTPPIDLTDPTPANNTSTATTQITTQPFCGGQLAQSPFSNATFGNGAGPGGITDLPTADPGATTTMNYVATACPNDGQYAVYASANNCFSNSWVNIVDHTTGNATGRAMIVNSTLGANNIFYKKTITGLCSGGSYVFSSWLANLDMWCGTNSGSGSNVYINPNVTFKIFDATATTLLASYNTGDIGQPTSLSIVWTQYGFAFTLPTGQTSVVLEIVDNAPGGCGNDLALDDITFTMCGPNTTAASSVTTVCSGGSATLTGTVQSGIFAAPVYQWQQSTDGGTTWTNISGATSITYTATNITTATQYRLLVAPDVSSIGNATCRVVTNAVSVAVSGTCPTDLAITKTGPATVLPSGAVSYSLVVTNNGPNAANGATVKDAAVTNFTATGVSCAGVSGGAVCPTTPTVATLQAGTLAIPTLPSGSSLTLVITGTAGTTGNITNIASVSAPAGITDSNPANNSSTAVTAIGTPFTCDGTVYLTRNSPTDFGKLSGSTIVTINSTGTLTYNSIGYNPVDNFIYGMEISPSLTHLVRVDATGVAVDLGVVSGVGASSFDAGVITPAGIYYFGVGSFSSGSATLYRIDLNTQPYVATTITLSTTLKGGDLVYNTIDGFLYSASDGGNMVQKIDPVTGTVTSLIPTSGTFPAPVNGYGSQWITTAGNLDFYNNNTGVLYEYNFTTGAVTQVASGLPTNTPTADAATCVVLLQADLAITKTGPSSVLPSGAVSYSLVVTNNGPSSADGATVKDAAATNFTASSVSCAGVSGGAVCPTTPTVATLQAGTLAIPTLPSGGSVTLVVTGTASTSGLITNIASVSAPTGVVDSNPANNSSTATTAVGITCANNTSNTQIPPAAVITPLLPTVAGATQNYGAFSITYSMPVSNTINTYTASGDVGLAYGNNSTNNQANYIFSQPLTNIDFIIDDFDACEVANLRFYDASNNIIDITPYNTHLTAGITQSAVAGQSVQLSYPSFSAAGNFVRYARYYVTVPVSRIEVQQISNCTGGIGTFLVNACTTFVTDLAITKTGPATVLPSGAVSYSLVVTNNGPSSADGATVKDAAATNFTASSVSCAGVSGGAVCPTTPTVATLQAGTLAIPTLPSGGSVTLVVTGTASTSGLITNIASVSAPAGVTDSNPANNSSTAVTAIGTPFTCANVAYQVASPTNSGTSTLYSYNVVTGTRTTISALAGSTVNAIGYNPIDNMIWGIRFDGTLVRIDATGATLNFTVPNLPSQTYQVGTMLPGGYLVIKVSNGANYYVIDLNPARSTYLQLVDPTAGYVLDTAPYGTSTSPTIDITDWVYDPSTGKLLAVIRPTATNQFKVASIDPTTGAVTFSAAVTGASFQSETDSYGSAFLDASGNFYVFSNNQGKFYKIDLATVTATLVSTTTASVFNDGTNCPTATLVPTTDLSITKTGPATVSPSGTVSYSLVITNNGPSAADGATISDPAVANFTVTFAQCSAQSGGANCIGAVTIATLQAGTLAIPTLPAGGSVTLVVTGTASSSTGVITNIASVSAPAGVIDSDPTNNSSTAVTSIVNPTTDLAIVKTGTTSVSPSGAVSYSLVITNNGPSAANGATVKDAAATNFTASSVSCAGVSGGAVCPTTPTVASLQAGTLAIPTLPSGGSVTLVVTGTAGSSTGVITNIASVSAPTGVTDSDPTNNSSTAVTSIATKSVDLAVVKAGPATANSNSTITYSLIISNTGPNAADGATVMDAAVTNFTAATVVCGGATGGAACPTSPTLAGLQAGTLSIPTLPAGGTVTLVLTGTTGTTGTIVNTVTVTAPSGVVETNTTNNTDSATTELPCIPGKAVPALRSN